MARVQGHEFPDDLHYDVENQVWYAQLPNGTLRAGYTSWAASHVGEALVFMPKRVGHSFEKGRWFAMVEGGKWVGPARAAFDGTVVAHNQALIDRPELLTSDPFGEGWMLVVQPARADWREGLIRGDTVEAAVEAWIAGGSYKERSG